MHLSYAQRKCLTCGLRFKLQSLIKNRLLHYNASYSCLKYNFVRNYYFSDLSAY